jgi:hypothetical protein
MFFGLQDLLKLIPEPTKACFSMKLLFLWLPGIAFVKQVVLEGYFM